jgi:hypothetical protein
MVYFIQNTVSQNIKIGYSTNVKSRLLHLQIGSAERLEVLLVLEGGTAYERLLHNQFAEFRLVGEWFMFAAPIKEFINGNREVKMDGQKDYLKVNKSSEQIEDEISYFKNLHNVCLGDYLEMAISWGKSENSLITKLSSLDLLKSLPDSELSNYYEYDVDHNGWTRGQRLDYMKKIRDGK